MTSFHKANPNLPEEVRRLVESGYVPALEAVPRMTTAPLWWSEREADGRTRRQGGTICFVHTGDRCIGVTAGHVHQEYLRRSDADPEIECQIGSSTFDPASRVVDWSADPDLATYDVPEFYVTAAGCSIHHAPEWPPLVSPADLYVVGGRPWILSRESGTYSGGPYAGVEQVTHSFLNFIGRLSTHSERNLGFLPYPSTSQPWGNAVLPAGTNLGGMSGGPIFRVKEDGLTQLLLVGCIYEYAPGNEILFGHPLSLIDGNGMIIR